jgi:hypothetical protein
MMEAKVLTSKSNKPENSEEKTAELTKRLASHQNKFKSLVIDLNP